MKFKNLFKNVLFNIVIKAIIVIMAAISHLLKKIMFLQWNQLQKLLIGDKMLAFSCVLFMTLEAGKNKKTSV